MKGLDCKGSRPYPAVAVVQANDQLLEYPLGFGLRQAAVRAMLQQVVEEVPALGILHRNGQVLGREEHLHPTHCPHTSSTHDMYNSQLLMLQWPGAWV